MLVCKHVSETICRLVPFYERINTTSGCLLRHPLEQTAAWHECLASIPLHMSHITHTHRHICVYVLFTYDFVHALVCKFLANKSLAWISVWPRRSKNFRWIYLCICLWIQSAINSFCLPLFFCCCLRFLCSRLFATP